jgi:hypothetical protein
MSRSMESCVANVRVVGVATRIRRRLALALVFIVGLLVRSIRENDHNSLPYARSLYRIVDPLRGSRCMHRRNGGDLRDPRPRDSRRCGPQVTIVKCFPGAEQIEQATARHSHSFTKKLHRHSSSKRYIRRVTARCRSYESRSIAVTRPGSEAIMDGGPRSLERCVEGMRLRSIRHSPNLRRLHRSTRREVSLLRRFGLVGISPLRETPTISTL